MFAISEQLLLEQSDEIFGVSQISWESTSWKQASLVNDGEVISLSHPKVYVFSDSVSCLGKMNQNPTSNTWERQLERFKDSSQNRTLDWTQSTKIRWEFERNIFHRIHYIGACPWSPKVHEQNERTWTIPRTNYLHVDVQWHHTVKIKTMKRECIANSTLVSLFEKDFQQDVGHSSDLGQKQNGIPLTEKDQEEDGIESLNWWWSNFGESDTQFSEQRVRSLQERSKAKEVDNYLFTSVPMVIRLELSFAQSFLSISSVSTEQSQICVKSTAAVKQEQGDLLWQSNLTPLLASRHWKWNPHLRLRFLHKKIFCRSTENEWKSSHNQINWLRLVRMQDSWKQLRPDNTILTSSYNLQSQWHVVSIRYHEMTNQLTRKVGFKGTPKLGSYWKLQPVTYKVSMKWKSELNMWTKTILIRGSEFLMAWTHWSQSWSTRSTMTTTRRLLQRRRKYLRLQADPRLKQNQEDFQLLAHLQGLFPLLKEHGLILNQELNSIKHNQWQKE